MRSFLVMAVAQAGCCASCLAEPPARSLDQALVDTLALGQAGGCGPAFGVPDFGFSQTGLDNYLKAERDAGRLGKEITAVCGSSAVTSAAALGGSLGSVQTTKTVSQFRMARNRADSRLKASGKRAGLDDRPMLLAQADPRFGLTTTDTLAFDPPDDDGPAVFVQVDHERRDRVTTALEAGYRAGVSEAIVGMDYVTSGNVVAGAWVGYRSANADYRSANVLIGGNNAQLFGASLGPDLQAQACKVSSGGGFDDKGVRLGAFVAKRFGDAFGDVGFQYSRRNYSYQRNVCAIEANNDQLVPDPTSPSGFSSGGIAVDDIYAGTISGQARLTEWGVSGRVGMDFSAGPLQWGPRLSITYLRSTIGAFTESGSTSVTHTVNSNTGILQTVRAAGDPTGLEIAFDAQRRTSLQSELQLVSSLRSETGFGTVVPRFSVSWIHEFKGDRELVFARMAQDLRANPTRFSYTTDAVDRNKGNVAVGVSLLRGPTFAADLEISRLLSDDRFDSTAVAMRALWRF